MVGKFPHLRRLRTDSAKFKPTTERIDHVAGISKKVTIS